MKFPILSFAILFGLPMACIIASLPPTSLHDVAKTTGLAVLLAVAAVLLTVLLGRLFRRRRRVPSARALARLAWPDSLSRGEMEGFCAAWLRSRGWTVTLTTEPDEESPGVYLIARRGGASLTVLCDPRGEDLNPAGIRAFAFAAARAGDTRPVLLTLARRTLPHAAEAAARQAGVTLLRVAELPTLDALAPATAPAAA
jgi:Restriction endonuclease